MNDFELKSLSKPVSVGYFSPVRVNCNVGANSVNEVEIEKNKIDLLFKKENTRPDIMMDLSTSIFSDPLYSYIINRYKIPVGVVPAYYFYGNCDKQNVLDVLLKQANDKVSFFTLHFTANIDLFEKAKIRRKIPVTSRGGGILLKSMLSTRIKENVYVELLDEIIKIALTHNIAISLGSTFRPASVVDALDDAHVEETKQQLEICKKLQSAGVNVIIENIGHIDLEKMNKHLDLLKLFNAPIMPLGPFPTDIGFELDHIASAIGAALLSYNGCAHIINSITPAEHFSNKISEEDLITGVKTAKLVSHILNMLKYQNEFKKDSNVYECRAKNLSCIMGENNSCDRCSVYCPLKIR